MLPGEIVGGQSRTSKINPSRFHFFFHRRNNFFSSRVNFTNTRAIALDCKPAAAVCVCVMSGPLRRPNPCGLLYRLPIGWARFRPGDGQP